MKRFFPLAALSLAALLLAPGLLQAGEGHDHGNAAPATGGPALPRFAAVSDSFELVGVLDGQHLTLYLDRAADNSPVPDAQIELEIAGAKLKAQRHPGDAFEVVLAAAPAAGVLPITATVTVGNEIDLLAGELDIDEPAHADAKGHEVSWKTYAGWGAAALAALVALFAVGRRLRAVRPGAAA